jgi:hypothetical protein
MVIDERLDIFVWSAALLLFLLLGARAWAVETAGARHYRTLARVRVLTGAVWVSLVVLLGLGAMQGGIALVQAIVTGTEPEDFVTIVGPQGDVESSPDPPAGDPAAPPADPNAPGPAPGAPEADPNAPGAGPDGAGPDADPGAAGAGPDAPGGGGAAGAPAAPGN